MADLSGYFDYAAATPMDAQVVEAMRLFQTDRFFNPSADYAPARDVKEALHEARSKSASLLGAKPLEIVFTAGGTEANNMALYGVMERYPDAKVVISAIEHESVRAIAKKYKNAECPVLRDGVIDIAALTNCVDDTTVLVSVMLANNEIGTVQPLRKISQALDTIKTQRKRDGNNLPLYLHTDAAQSANYLDVHVHRLGVDMMSLNGGKLYGPKQTGILFVRGGMSLEPLIVGGGQEKNLRSGTENVPGVVGLAEALHIAVKSRQAEVKRLSNLQGLFMRAIQEKIPSAAVNGSTKNRLPNNVHLTLKGQDNERLLMLLDAKGIYAAAGSACSATHEEPSHVLQAIGLDEDAIRSSLRFTMGRYTKEADIVQAVDTLVSVLA